MPIKLRFCPSCVEQDSVNYGETYWHRIHQLPGVEVCPHHAVLLEESNASWRNSRNFGEAILAELSVYDTPARIIDISDHTQRIQLEIARCALQLLEWAGSTVDSETLRLRYYNLLLRQGLATYNGQIRTTQLIQKLLDFYPSELLIRLGCEIRNPNSNWLLRLFRLCTAEIAHHPIRHILLLILIGGSLEGVLGSFVEYKPFGDGPWPCLNKASDHYTEPRVLFCRITNRVKANKGKPLGTFSCSCGFTYMRAGPDKSEEDRLKWTCIQSYGIEWENLLKQYWDDTSLTLRQVAMKLGVIEFTVNRRAISLNLTFPRPTHGTLRSSGIIPKRYKIKIKPFQDILKMKREAFLLLINDNSQASRTELKMLAPTLTDWLRCWDQEWLNASLPPAKKYMPRITLNWEEQDLILSKAVKTAALHIRSITDPPKRVSKAAIIKIVGHRAWIEKYLNKMPLTLQVLDSYLETFEDYTLRRIDWVDRSLSKGES